MILNSHNKFKVHGSIKYQKSHDQNAQALWVLTSNISNQIAFHLENQLELLLYRVKSIFYMKIFINECYDINQDKSIYY